MINFLPFSHKFSNIREKIKLTRIGGVEIEQNAKVGKKVNPQ